MEQYSSSVTEKVREREPALLPPPFALCHGTIEKQALGLGIMGFFSGAEGTGQQKTRLKKRRKKFKVKPDVFFCLFVFSPYLFLCHTFLDGIARHGNEKRIVRRKNIFQWLADQLSCTFGVNLFMSVTV